MNISFWIALILMTIGATAFLLLPAMQRAKSGKPQTPFLLIAIIVPILAIMLYANLGSPQAAVADTGARTAPGAARTMAAMSQTATTASQQKSVASVGDLVDGLAERLKQNPDDAGGWLLLAKSYRHLERRDDAEQAYARAKALGSPDDDLEAWLSGATSTPAPHPLPAAGATEGTEIRGRVSIDPGSAAIDGSATVFIVARAATGSPMPLAVVRTTVAELPYEFSITDANSMMAGNAVSAAGEVVISAKVSIEGDALKTVPGLEAKSEPVSTANPGFVELQLGH